MRYWSPYHFCWLANVDGHTQTVPTALVNIGGRSCSTKHNRSLLASYRYSLLTRSRLPILPFLCLSPQICLLSFGRRSQHASQLTAVTTYTSPRPARELQTLQTCFLISLSQAITQQLFQQHGSRIRTCVDLDVFVRSPSVACNLSSSATYAAYPFSCVCSDTTRSRDANDVSQGIRA
jgi:hypothetical protein